MSVADILQFIKPPSSQHAPIGGAGQGEGPPPREWKCAIFGFSGAGAAVRSTLPGAKTYQWRQYATVRVDPFYMCTVTFLQPVRLPTQLFYALLLLGHSSLDLAPPLAGLFLLAKSLTPREGTAA